MGCSDTTESTSLNWRQEELFSTQHEAQPLHYRYHCYIHTTLTSGGSLPTQLERGHTLMCLHCIPLKMVSRITTVVPSVTLTMDIMYINYACFFQSPVLLHRVLLLILMPQVMTASFSPGTHFLLKIRMESFLVISSISLISAGKIHYSSLQIRTTSLLNP